MKTASINGIRFVESAVPEWWVSMLGRHSPIAFKPAGDPDDILRIGVGDVPCFPGDTPNAAWSVELVDRENAILVITATPIREMAEEHAGILAELAKR